MNAREDEYDAMIERNEPEEWQAVFWDIGGVILDVSSVRAGHRRFVERFVARHELDADPEAALDTWRSTVGAHFHERDGTEFRSARRAYALAAERLAGEYVPESAWLPLFREATEATLRPNPSAVETVERLAESGLHVGVVSDVDTDEGRHILGHFGLLDAFDTITTSEAVGCTKPDPAVFEAALSAADVDPARSLMVGDRYEHDMAGGKRAGLWTAAYGAEEGPAIDYRLGSLVEVLDIVGVEG